MNTDTVASRPTPRVFVSYSWDDDPHKEWVKVFATRLRSDGVDVTLDRWHLQPGDQLPAFMERAVRENDYVLIVCTPTYADRSNRRIGGVGYEGDIMTGEVFTSRNERKFIPVWRLGAQWNVAAPSWLLAKYRIDLRGDPFSEQQYQDLLITLHGTRLVADRPSLSTASGSDSAAAMASDRKPMLSRPSNDISSTSTRSSAGARMNNNRQGVSSSVHVLSKGSSVAVIESPRPIVMSPPARRFST
jgi:hypothetical protein